MMISKEEIVIKIGELANLTGVAIQTIRYWEEEGLISPIEVDRWTGYRYFDQGSVERISEILFLKDLGFSLHEIKNLSEEIIKNKISQTKLKIASLGKNITKLSSIRKEKGEFIMKNFVNDEKVIGKWKKIAVVKDKEDFKKGKFEKENLFNFNELYFLPEGKEYWVFSWTKGALFLKDRKFPYEVIDGKMFISIVDFESGEIDDYAVYEQVDCKKYDVSEIQIKDDTNIPFVDDKNVIGFWTSVDFVANVSDFKTGEKQYKDEFYLKKYAFEPNGNLTAFYGNGNHACLLAWSKGVVIDRDDDTVSEYIIKTINGDDYMFVEWKSGDYKFGGKVMGQYVLKKAK